MIHGKRSKALLYSLSLVCYLIGTAPNTVFASENIKIEEIYKKFDLHSIRSSVGPRLKAYCGNNLYNIVKDEITDISTNKNSLSIETEDWIYNFSIKTENGNTLLGFYDNAKHASYNTYNTYIIEYDSKRDRWYAVAEVVQNKNEENTLKKIEPKDWIEEPDTDMRTKAKCGGHPQ